MSALHSSERSGLVADSLTDRRGFRELYRDLSFNLAAGECLELTGPNGSGKSTLLHNLCGLRQPEAGHVSWNGLSVTENGFRSSVRFLGHRSGLKLALTVRENLQLLLGLNAEVSDITTDVLEELRLAGCADLPLRQLSAGQRRRVALARLRLTPGEVWILDEPFSALDVEAREWIISEIQHFCHSGGTVVLTTHHAVDIADVRLQRLELGQSVRASA